MISVKGTIDEMDKIKKEISRNMKINSELRKRYNKLEVDVLSFFEKNGEESAKYKNLAIFVENKAKYETKKVKDVERDAARVLEEYGVDSSDAMKVLKKLSEAKKGEEAMSKKIKIKPITEAMEKKRRKRDEY